MQHGGRRRLAGLHVPQVSGSIGGGDSPIVSQGFGIQQCVRCRNISRGLIAAFNRRVAARWGAGPKSASGHS
eukprot:scaffold1314_cov205-Isochrysis_galbana.AAC.1